MTPSDSSAAPASTHLIQGERIAMPVEIRDASTWTAIFTLPAAAAADVLKPIGLEPSGTYMGKALCGVGFVRYTDGDLGPYHEFLIALMARRGGVENSEGAFIHWLPVNQTFTCEAGQSIWGFPKEIANVDIVRSGRRTTCEVRLDGQLVVSVDIGSGAPMPTTLAARRSVGAYSFRDGNLRKTPWRMDIGGLRVRPGGAHLEWGTHPKADQLRSLGISPRALLSTSVSELRMVFEDPEVIVGGGI